MIYFLTMDGCFSNFLLNLTDLAKDEIGSTVKVWFIALLVFLIVGNILTLEDLCPSSLLKVVPFSDYYMSLNALVSIRDDSKSGST